MNAKKAENLAQDDRSLDLLIKVLAVAVVLAVVGFGVYYYLNNYYYSQPPLIEQVRTQTEEAIAKDPNSLDLRMQAAVTYYKTKQFDLAIQQFNEALKIKDDHQPAIMGLGLSYAFKGEPEPAIEQFEYILDLNKDNEYFRISPDGQSVIYHLGRMYTLTGDLARAEELLKEVFARTRADADTIFALSEVYRLQGKLDEALYGYYLATKYIPDFKEVYEAMAKAYEAQGLQHGVTYARAMVKFSENEYDAAIAGLLQALRENPQDDYIADVYFGLGMAYERKKDNGKALEAYQNAAKYVPDEPLVKDALKRLQSTQPGS